MTGWDHGADHHHEPWEDPSLPEEPTHFSDPYDLGSPDHHEVSFVEEPPGLPADEPAELPVEHAFPAEPVESSAESFDPADDSPAAWADDTATDPFPPALDMDVSPADGGPWTDPELIGGDPADLSADLSADFSAGPDVDPPAALLPDLAAADGDPSAGWATLHDSDDPAVRALARHWHR